MAFQTQDLLSTAITQFEHRSKLFLKKFNEEIAHCEESAKELETKIAVLEENTEETTSPTDSDNLEDIIDFPEPTSKDELESLKVCLQCKLMYAKSEKACLEEENMKLLKNALSECRRFVEFHSHTADFDKSCKQILEVLKKDTCEYKQEKLLKEEIRKDEEAKERIERKKMILELAIETKDEEDTISHGAKEFYEKNFVIVWNDLTEQIINSFKDNCVKIVRKKQEEQRSLEDEVKQLRSEVRQMTENSEKFLKSRFEVTGKLMESLTALLRNNFSLDFVSSSGS